MQYELLDLQVGIPGSKQLDLKKTCSYLLASYERQTKLK